MSVCAPETRRNPFIAHPAKSISWISTGFCTSFRLYGFLHTSKAACCMGANPYEEYRPRGLSPYPGDVSQGSRAPWCCSFSPGKKLRPRINSLRPAGVMGLVAPHGQRSCHRLHAWGCCRLNKPRVSHPRARARKGADVPLVVRDQLVVMLWELVEREPLVGWWIRDLVACSAIPRKSTDELMDVWRHFHVHVCVRGCVYANMCRMFFAFCSPPV